MGYKHFLWDINTNVSNNVETNKIEKNKYKDKVAGLKEQLKIPHVEDQERKISYYTKLLKQRVTQNNIFDIKDHQGNLHHDIEEKLKSFHNFDNILYSEERPDEQVNAQKDLLRAIKQKRNNGKPQFPQELKDALNSKIPEQEVLKLSKPCQTKKVPA